MDPTFKQVGEGIVPPKGKSPDLTGGGAGNGPDRKVDGPAEIPCGENICLDTRSKQVGEGFVPYPEGKSPDLYVIRRPSEKR